MNTTIPIIKKAVFPVAGLGTRFLPVTKATPKEMLPIVDKPLIQFAVEEACAAGIKELIFIINRHKYAIQDHFDSHPELEARLEQQGKIDLLKNICDIIPKDVTCTFIRQPKAEGLGHAVFCAKEQVGNEPFAVLLADEWIEELPNGCLHEMMRIYNQTQASVIALTEVSRANTANYGIADIDANQQIHHLIEKPNPKDAPSNFAVSGRYILQPSIFAALEQISPDAKGEIQLTDAIALNLEKEWTYGYYIKGTRFDCGSKFGYLQATLHYGLKHPEVAELFKSYLKNKISRDLL